MRTLVAALIVLLWLLLGWFYKNTSDQCCKGDTDATTTEVIEVPAPVDASDAPKSTTLLPLTFSWSDALPSTNDGWDEMKANLLSSLGPNDKLQITGLYRASEENPTNANNLGLARASEARQLFPSLADDRIILNSRLVEDDVKAGNKAFASVQFRTLQVGQNVKETGNGTLIYFAYNSTKKLDNQEIETYLDAVATRVKESGESIKLTGHTDNRGDRAFNKMLGRRRAEAIQQYLLSQGVDSDQISVHSAGESAPIKSNDTPAGRAANRRTELQIIQ